MRIKLNSPILKIFLIIFILHSSCLGMSICKAGQNSNNKTVQVEISSNDPSREEIKNVMDYLQVLRLDLHQSTIESYNRSSDAANKLISILTLLATIFGVLIALAGVFVTYESIRSKQRSDKAIQTLETAKLYVEEKTGEFNKFIQMQVNLLAQETEKASRKVEERAKEKVKEIEEKNIPADTENKIKTLERRIQFFDEIGIPNDPNLLYSKAMIFKEKGMAEESLRLLGEVVKLSPSYREAYWQIGLLELERGNFDKSIQAYSQYIALNPSEASAYNNTGIALERSGKKEAAIHFFDKAIEFKPNDPLYYSNKGRVFEFLGKTEEALLLYNKAIELGGKERFYVIQKINLLEKLKKRKEALSLIQAYLSSNQIDLVMLKLAGRLLRLEGKEGEAIVSYNKACDIEKNKLIKQEVEEADYLEHFETLIITKRNQEAVSFQEEIKEKIKSRLYLYNFLCASLSFINGKDEEGVKQISKLLEALKIDNNIRKESWNFEDINLILKVALKKGVYSNLTVIEKIILKELPFVEAEKEIRNWKEASK
ncbi:MAG: tetratricopeptide repeat protein [Candidatus Omnitrophica bacterium]|nr:tetratricopeptide repeat protein [Candidatus Omnitrophota bacterium]